MDKLLTGVLTAPIATIFIISGIIFLFISVVGNISGKIEPSVKSRIASGIFGLIFIFTGLMIHLNQEEPKIPIVTSSEKIKADSLTKAPQIKDSSKVNMVSEQAILVLNIVDKEPNDYITNANFIALGTTIRGAIATEKDRDFYKFEALSSKTRVILRKLSRAGFVAQLEVYDAVENKIKTAYQYDDTPVTLSFKSVMGATYYVVIESSYEDHYHNGEYELVVQKEK